MWEYYVEDFLTQDTYELNKFLELHGKDGWELVAVLPSRGFMCFFKRRIQNSLGYAR